MPVYKDENAKKNKWYYSFSYKEGGKYKKKLKRGFKTKKEAEKAMMEVQDAMNKGNYIEPSTVLYRDFIQSWINDKKTNVQKSTVETYTYLIERFVLPALGDIELSKITPRDIQSLYNDLKNNNKLGDENIRKVHTLINESLNKAFKWEMIIRNPAALVDPPKISRKEVEVWDEEEVQKFLAVAKDSRYYEAFLISLTTGMRQGEVLGLRMVDIDEKNLNFSIVQTLSHKGDEIKTGAKTQAGNRTISVDEQTMKQVLKLKERYEIEKEQAGPIYKDSGLVIRTSVGTPLSPRNLLRTFYGLIEKAGVKKIRFHDLRHTHASLLLRQGVNPKIVSERLGHANVRITLDRYSHLLPNLQKDTAAAFGQAFYKNQNE